MKNKKKMKGELPKVRLAEDGTYHVIGPADPEDRIIVIPSTINSVAVTQIEDKAFADCIGLVYIALPYGLKSIGNEAFRECINLQQIDFPKSLTRIGNEAFAGCFSLERIFIPASVNEIGNTAFGGCIGVSEMVVDAQNPIYRSEGNCIIHIEYKIVIAGCKTSVIPRSPDVIAIASGVFWYISGEMTSITIPKNVMVIDSLAFVKCQVLKSIILFEGLQMIGEGAFLQCTKLSEIDLPLSLSSIGAMAFTDCYNLESIEIPEAVTAIERETFMGCVRLADVSLSDSIEMIDYSAFKDCVSLERFTIPFGVTYIGKGAFENCQTLGEVEFENPNGWMANGQLLDLSSPETAARYLTCDFCDFEWEREDD